MKIGITGPLATVDIAHLLKEKSGPVSEMPGSTLVVTLIEELIAHGHQVAAFTTEPSLAPKRNNIVVAYGDGLSVYYVPRRRRGFWFDRGCRGRMVDLFKLEREALVEAIHRAAPDIVHAHWTYEFGWAAQDSGVPCLITCHDAPWTIFRLTRDLYRAGRLLMAHRVLRRARHLTAVSPYLLDELSKFTAAPIEIVPNPLQNKLLALGRTRKHTDFEHRPARVIMIVSGWSKIKNAAIGMTALAELKKKLPDMEINLVGSGFGVGEIAEKWALGRGVNRYFNFRGRLPYVETQRLLEQSDILVHTSLEESFGMTVAEAMAFGVPVVAGERSGAIPWVTGDGQAGLLVDVCSAEAVADAVKQLLDRPGLYARCSASGRTRAQQVFSQEAVAEAYLLEYRRILGEYR